MTNRPVTCPRCSGARTVEIGGLDSSPCPECDGSGWISIYPEDEDEDQAQVPRVPGSEDWSMRLE